MSPIHFHFITQLFLHKVKENMGYNFSFLKFESLLDFILLTVQHKRLILLFYIRINI